MAGPDELRHVAEHPIEVSGVGPPGFVGSQKRTEDLSQARPDEVRVGRADDESTRGLWVTGAELSAT